MEEIKKELTEAFAILAMLNVSGDAVDLMAAVRAKLKRAIKLTEPKEDTDG